MCLYSLWLDLGWFPLDCEYSRLLASLHYRNAQSKCHAFHLALCNHALAWRPVSVESDSPNEQAPWGLGTMHKLLALNLITERASSLGDERHSWWGLQPQWSFR